MIPKKQKFNVGPWQACLPLILLFVAGCSKPDGMVDQQPSQAEPQEPSPEPRHTTGKTSVARLEAARNTPPTEGSKVTSSAVASKPRADVARPSPVNGAKHPYEESIETRRPIPPPTPTWSRVEPSATLRGDDRETELHFARFLIKAGLSPMAVQSLRQIIKESPGTQAAREAQQVLDSIAKTK
jgi:hypothetical protein